MDIKIFTERLLNGDIIPFIGSDIHLLSEPPIISPDELSQKMSERLCYEASSISLPKICNYYQMENGRAALLSTIQQIICTGIQANPVFQLLSEIKEPLLIISSLYDDELEKVFDNNNKPYVLISHHLRTSFDDSGKILIKDCKDADPTSLPCTKEALSGYNFLKEGKSVIYKIQGGYNLSAKNQPAPLIISEQDFFNFLKLIENMLPDYLVSRFTNKSLLFLGYNLQNWHERLIATTILEKKERLPFSYVIRTNADKYEKILWDCYNVRMRETGLIDFIRDIKEILPTLEIAKLEASPALREFDVFLCHNSEDKAAVKKIGELLKAKGLNPWLDIEQLRPGSPWQTVLEEQIKHIKSVAVFLGNDGIGPWQDMEQQAFIREFKKRKCPIIPVILPECSEDQELPIFLSLMHFVNFRKIEPDPLQQLIWGITGKKTE
jgi:hypothetical protein